MNIELVIDREKKTFKLPSFIPGRMVRKAVSFAKLDTNNINDENLDEMVEFVTKIYGDKFSIDEFYDGIDAREMMNVIANAILGIVDGTIEAAGLTKNPNL